MFSREDYSFLVKYGNLTPDGVAVYDLNARKFVYLNPFFERMFAVKAESLMSDSQMIIRAVHPEDVSFLEDRYRELLSIGCIGPTEFRLLMKNGEIRHVTAEVFWVEDSYTFAIFAKDVTPARLYEEYVLKFTAQKDSLLDMLIHNLSGPLYLSRDVLRLLSESNGKKDEAGRLVSIMRQNTEKCLDIVNDFLIEEHSESARSFVKNTRFSVVEKINLVLKLFREMNPEKQFILDAAKHPLNLYSDPVKFCQVIENLLANAVKYTHDNGSIIIGVFSEGKACHITIQDDGVGVPDTIKAQLFHSRVEGTPGLKGEKSHGMGLLLVKQLVDLLGGKISLKSSPDEGTEIRLSIPEA